MLSYRVLRPQDYLREAPSPLFPPGRVLALPRRYESGGVKRCERKQHMGKDRGMHVTKAQVSQKKPEHLGTRGKIQSHEEGRCLDERQESVHCWLCAKIQRSSYR